MIKQKEYFKVFGKGDWLNIGDVTMNIYNKNVLRIGLSKVLDSDDEILDLKKEVIKSINLFELIFGSKVIDVSDNGIGRGGFSIDIFFDRDL